MNYLSTEQYQSAKRRLRAAVKRGVASNIIEVVDAQFDEWNDGGYAWPDDWANWQIARDDAVHEAALTGWGW